MGKCLSASTGPTSALILSAVGTVVGGSIRVIVTVRRQYAERYFAAWVNEVYLGNYWCDEDGVFELTLPVNYGSVTGSLYIEDVGMFSSFEPEDIEYLEWHAKEAGGLTSQNLVLQWDVEGVYRISTVYGDDQVSSITVSGAKRGVNVEDVPDFATRGRLRYSLIDVSGDRILRWWNGNTLVAEGVRTGDGAVTCNEIEGSGLTIIATIAYSSAVEKSNAFLDIKWPAKYQIHISGSALSFPRTPEYEVMDRGDGPYTFVAYGLTPGTKYFNVVPVDDEGEEQYPVSDAADSPVTIRTVPAAPTITGISGTAAAGITFTFTNGEAGCTYTLYLSKKNEPINFGDLTGGFTPVTTAMNATSVTSAAIADYAAEDLEPAYDDLVDDWNNFVAGANTAFASGASGFAATFSSFTTDVLASLAAFIDSTGFPLADKSLQIEEAAAQVQEFLDAVGTSLESDDVWRTRAGIYYGGFVAFLGSMLDGNANRWTLPNGALAGSSGGGASSPDSVDGELGETVQSGTTIKALVTPFSRLARFRALIRATNGGVEEQNGSVVEFELDALGAIEADRPNRAQVESVSIDGLDINVVGGIFDEDGVAEAESLELYVHTGILVLGSPDDVQVLPSSGVNGYRTVVFDPVTVGAAGWYMVSVIALTADGGRSLVWDTVHVHVDEDPPSAVLNLRGFVARSKGR